MLSSCARVRATQPSALVKDAISIAGRDAASQKRSARLKTQTLLDG